MAEAGNVCGGLQDAVADELCGGCTSFDEACTPRFSTTVLYPAIHNLLNVRGK